MFAHFIPRKQTLFQRVVKGMADIVLLHKIKIVKEILKKNWYRKEPKSSMNLYNVV